MNKPAAKEPSMDEILSSIRQIIADDDAGLQPRKPVPTQLNGVSPLSAPPVEPAPLALSSEQILRETASRDESRSNPSFAELLSARRPEPTASQPPIELVDPEDVTFEFDQDEPAPAAAPVAPPASRFVPSAPRPSYAPPPPRPAATIAQAAPMPDPTLSADIAETILGTATQSAVKSTFARLNGLSSIGAGVTIEDMIRDMLRPMLKEWLDENLPSVVERMVEREIERVSRGR